MSRAVAIAILPVLLLQSCASTTPATPIATDVCEISERSKAFDGKVVTLHAGILSDLVEHTNLISSNCPSCTLAVALEANAEGGDAMKMALTEAMPDGAITAVFTGTFEWHANETPARLLKVSAVRQLVVRR